MSEGTPEFPTNRQDIVEETGWISIAAGAEIKFYPDGRVRMRNPLGGEHPRLSEQEWTDFMERLRRGELQLPSHDGEVAPNTDIA